MTGLLDGKVAFITGIARGQGRSHAMHLAGQGADIVGLDLCGQVESVDYQMSTPDDLEQTVKMVENLGRRVIANVADVRNIEDIRATFDQGLMTFGHIDLIIANAGVMPIWGRYANTTQAWQDSLDILLTGVMNTVEVAYPQLIKQSTGGSIVITGSMAGVVPTMRTTDAHTLGLLGYSAAKAALVNLAENYASILATHRIRVNVIHPTGVHTPMIDNDMVRDRFANIGEEDRLALVNAIPVDAVDVDDISNAVVWLCSEGSRYFTGSSMRIDAGASLR